MGVDAKMFVRNRGPRLSVDDLRGLSVKLQAELPAHPFEPQGEEKGVLSFVRTLGEYRAELAHDRIAYPDAASFLQEEEETASYPDHLQIWEQDGPCLISAPDEQLIEVHLFARYFGGDCRRGPWREIRAIADWLEMRVPNSEVWYGGDSSGIVAERLTLQFKDACSKALEEDEEEERRSGG